MSIREEVYTLSNTTLYVQTAGETGAPILLIHGFLASSFSWRKLIPVLKEHFKVYAVDLPGFGKSGKGRKFPYTITAYAELLLQFLNTQDEQNVTVIAHSMGGQVAMRLAKRAPDRINKLVMISPSCYLPAISKRYKLFCSLPLTHRIVPFMINEQRIWRELKNVVYDPEATDLQELYDGYVPPLKDKQFPRALLQFARARENDLSSDELKQIQQPALLIWGRHDRIVPLKVGTYLQRDLPQATLHIVEQAGHLSMEERPDDVLSYVLPFLQKTSIHEQTLRFK